MSKNLLRYFAIIAMIVFWYFGPLVTDYFFEGSAEEPYDSISTIKVITVSTDTIKEVNYGYVEGDKCVDWSYTTELFGQEPVTTTVSLDGTVLATSTNTQIDEGVVGIETTGTLTLRFNNTGDKTVDLRLTVTIGECDIAFHDDPEDPNDNERHSHPGFMPAGFLVVLVGAVLFVTRERK